MSEDGNMVGSELVESRGVDVAIAEQAGGLEAVTDTPSEGAVAMVDRAMIEKPFHELTADEERQELERISYWCDHERSMALLKKEWGADLEFNLEFAESFIRAAGGDELLRIFEVTNLQVHPVIVRAAAQAGRLLAQEAGNPGTIPDLVSGGIMSEQQKAAAETRFAELTEEIYMAQKRGDGGKAQRLQNERSRLSEQLYSNKE